MTRNWLVLTLLLAPFAAHAASDRAPPDFTPAPVPNLDLSAPIRGAEVGPTFSGSLQEHRIQLRSGDGYTPYSNFSEDLERRSRAAFTGFTPTISIKFPLN
jgi:hypothetical protein